MDRLLLLTQISTSTMRILPQKRTLCHTNGVGLAPGLVLAGWQELRARVTHLWGHARHPAALCTAGINSFGGNDITPVLLLFFQQCYGSTLGLQPHQPTANRVSTQHRSIHDISPGVLGAGKLLQTTTCVLLFISALKAEEIAKSQSTFWCVPQLYRIYSKVTHKHYLQQDTTCSWLYMAPVSDYFGKSHLYRTSRGTSGHV